MEASSILNLWFTAASTAFPVVVVGAILTIVLSLLMERLREIFGGPLLPPRRKRGRGQRVPRLHPPFHASGHQ